MPFWLLLLTANAWGLLILIQGAFADSKERLLWLQRRALLCAWMAFVGAAIVVGLYGYLIYAAYTHGASGRGLDVPKAMKSILVALLLVPVPLMARVVVNRRLQKKD